MANKANVALTRKKNNKKLSPKWNLEDVQNKLSLPALSNSSGVFIYAKLVCVVMHILALLTHKLYCIMLRLCVSYLSGKYRQSHLLNTKNNAN